MVVKHPDLAASWGFLPGNPRSRWGLYMICMICKANDEELQNVVSLFPFDCVDIRKEVVPMVILEE